VRYLGEFPAAEAAIRMLVAKVAAKYRLLTFCYESGPTGYWLYRLLKSLGHECLVGDSLARLRRSPATE
jgi:transposase